MRAKYYLKNQYIRKRDKKLNALLLLLLVSQPNV